MKFIEELEFFIKNQDDLVKKYGGKTLVIKGTRIVGIYDDPLRAFLEASKTHTPGSFMIQPCEPGTEAYSVTVTSYKLLVQNG